MLEEKKQEEFNEDMKQSPLPPPPHNAGNSRNESDRINPERLFNTPSEQQFLNQFKSQLGLDRQPQNLCDYAPMLRDLGDEFMNAGEKMESDTRIRQDIRTVGGKALKLYAILPYGYASQLYEDCGFKDEAYAIWDKHRKDFAKLADLTDDLNKIKAKDQSNNKVDFATKLCIGPTCFFKDGDKFKVEVSAVFGEFEFRGGHKFTDFGCKIALGPEIKGGIGSVSLEARASLFYFDIDMSAGPSVGSEIKLATDIFSVNKYLDSSYKGEATVSVAKLNLENYIYKQ
ncbi:MAG: hypothetical protein HY753_07305 [Nitrospirae bacterium]|nr:hypothetical protein [Nitrospirota bacterium]